MFSLPQKIITKNLITIPIYSLVGLGRKGPQFFEDSFALIKPKLGEIDWFNLVQNKASEIHFSYH